MSEETQRIPVNVRIAKELVEKMEASGMTKTEVVTEALEQFFLYDKSVTLTLQSELNDCKVQLSVLQAKCDELEKSKEITLQMYSDLKNHSEYHMMQVQTLINQIETKKKTGFLTRLLKGEW